MTISSKCRWRSSEDIALQYLEEKGYIVLERGVKVRIDRIEVGEADAVVRDTSSNLFTLRPIVSTSIKKIIHFQTSLY